MRQVEVDDALIELAEAIILQAVEDFRGLKARGAFCNGVVLDGFWERRNDSGGLKCPMNLRSSNDARELLVFLNGWALDFLCDLTGHKDCRIRKALGIRKGE
jgi:hypothetical protein